MNSSFKYQVYPKIVVATPLPLTVHVSSSAIKLYTFSKCMLLFRIDSFPLNLTKPFTARLADLRHAHPIPTHATINVMSLLLVEVVVVMIHVAVRKIDYFCFDPMATIGFFRYPSSVSFLFEFVLLFLPLQLWLIIIIQYL